MWGVNELKIDTTAGLVDSFNRPGANLTGYTLWTNEMEAKRVGLLRELVPGVALVGVLLNPNLRPQRSNRSKLRMLRG